MWKEIEPDQPLSEMKFILRSDTDPSASVESDNQPPLQINIEDNASNELVHAYQSSITVQERRPLLQLALVNQPLSQLDTKLEDLYQEAQSSYQSGVSAQEHQQWDLAEHYYQQALETYKKHNSIERQIDVHNQLEEVYQAKGEYEKAVDSILENVRLNIGSEDKTYVENKFKTLKALQEQKRFDETIQQKIAEFIISNYLALKDLGNEMLDTLAWDASTQVKSAVIQAISSEAKPLDDYIRLLQSKLTSSLITIQIVKGSGVVIERENELVLRVTNQSGTFLNEVVIELCPSAEYIIFLYKQSIASLAPYSSEEICFRITLKVAKQVAINYRINNGEMKEPALYINGIIDNPYIYGDPVNEATAFFGREHELEQLLQAMTKPAKQDILLIGERRTGKTSLLYQIQRRLKAPFIPVYINLSACYADTNSMLNHILEKIILALVEQHVLDDGWNINHLTHIDFTERVYEIIQFARKKLADVNIILLLDEADFLLAVEEKNNMTYLIRLFGKHVIDESIQRFLRAALQSSKIGGCLRATVAGTTDLSTYVLQRSSPFFNHFRFISLKPLTKRETEDLIVKPANMLGFSYSSEAVLQISHLSGGHPYYCQALCYEAFSYTSQENITFVDSQAVAVAEDKIRTDFSHAYRVGFWNRATSRERKILVTLAQGKSLNNLSNVQVKRLLDWQLLVKEHNIYHFSAGLFKQWTMIAAGKDVSHE